MMIAFVAIAFLVGYFGVTYVMNKVAAGEQVEARKDPPKEETEDREEPK